MLNPITVTAAVTLAVVAILSIASSRSRKATTLRARRTTGIIQMLRWFVTIVGLGAIAIEALIAAGVESSTLAIVAGGLVTATAFAVREPISDFLSAAMMIVDRTAVIGDEVEINDELAGRLAGFGLRSVAVTTWTGDVVYVAASNIRTLRNVSKGASRVVIDIDIPATVRTGRAGAVLEAACGLIDDRRIHSRPEVLGVVEQHLDRYVMRLTCMVDPAEHREVGYRLKAVAADAVAGLLLAADTDDPGALLDTQEMLRVVPEIVTRR
ncbi:MAG: mechanosensitive ion channel family protein [Ilumatobacteraceae bacterium]